MNSEGKPVWILNHYGGLPGEVRSDRTWRMAEAFSEAGFDVTLFHASRHHILNAPLPPERVDRVWDSGRGYRVCAVRVRPYEGNGIGRLFNMLDFARGVERMWKEGTVEPPSAIVASSPHPLVLGLAASVRRKTGAVFVFEERDIWPRSLVDLAGASRFHPVVLLFGLMVRKAYRNCDALVSLLPGSEPYLREQGLPAGRFHYIPNGSVLEGDEALRGEDLPGELREEVDGARRRGEFLVVYTGAMGAPNALGQWFDLAPLMAAERKAGAYPYRVLLVGEGWERRLLQERSREPGFDYVSVHGPVSKAAALALIRMADACAVSLKPVPLFQLGVSPNKLFDYFAAAKPVLFLIDSRYNPVETAQAGMTVFPGDPGRLHAAVMALRSMSPEERRDMGLRGRSYASEHHNWSRLGRRYAELLQILIAEKETGGGTSNRGLGGLKRAFDLVISLVALVLLAPLLLVLAALVARYLGSPVFFRQTRIGLGGKSFNLVKFRTMTDARDEQGQLLPDSERLTAFGRFLRAASLDELPELWNVVRGDLSLVGPRPLLPEYLPLYSPHQARRHEVRPGITGWAQVNGRNATSWEERFDMDVWYVNHRSFGLDLKILCWTVGVVFRRDGISAEGSATMPKFTGSLTRKGGDGEASA